MKNKTLILALALTFLVTGCNKADSPSSKVSEETIAKALDKKVDLEKEKANEEKTDEKSSDSKFEITGKNLKKLLTDIGEFDPAFVRKLDDDELIKLYEKAEEESKDTGYWDVKDFFFQELANENPEKSLKFPLDSVESKYNWQASQDDTIGNKFEYERNTMVENGEDYNEVWSYTDKEMEDAFHEAYEKDPLAYYEDYVKMAYEILSGEDQGNSKNDKKSTSKEDGAANPEDYENLLKFGSSDKDYQALKEALVNHYEFDKKIVDKIPNKDIDLAFTRAQKRLEETGFGDIGLVFDELGKLYPGASTMYTGKN
ncbi:hypothetical protein NH286_04805 [Anaerococcus sp. NML200574]|uniref:hypothetical protein n=1 Tax=Anaerococcus sp. NML200574 TaxID=2954486 RepID=UPI002238D3FB|nr:hypothetical protein [Anaerococcus sp. NML200574]MCW6678472.1 hypothetical protein [Anaerococcus sp. NML200574]